MTSLRGNKRSKENDKHAMEDFEAMISDDIQTTDAKSTTTTDNDEKTIGNNADTTNKTNWLLKATSNVIQQAKHGRAKREENTPNLHQEEIDSVTVNTTSNQGQKLWGVSSSSSIQSNQIRYFRHNTFGQGSSPAFQSSCDDCTSSTRLRLTCRLDAVACK